jgi:glutathione S-transferase
LAGRFDLYGKGEREHGEVDMFIDQAIDLQSEMSKVNFMQDEEAKKQSEKKLLEETLPPKLSLFEQRLSRTGKEHLLPSGLTVADLYLVAVLENLGTNKEQVLAGFPHIAKLDNSVRSHPKISAYLSSRPQTQF